MLITATLLFPPAAIAGQQPKSLATSSSKPLSRPHWAASPPVPTRFSRPILLPISSMATMTAATVPVPCSASQPPLVLHPAPQGALPASNSPTQPMHTECLVVDPASFQWGTQAPSPTPQQGPSPNPMQPCSLTHIQHDELLQEGPTPTHAHDMAALRKAAAALRQGLPVAVSTETVYGLAANALCSSAVKSIYAAKRRPADNPLIIHISSLDMLESLYPPGWTLPEVYKPVVAAHWPGPLTILLPRSEKVCARVCVVCVTVCV